MKQETVTIINPGKHIKVSQILLGTEKLLFNGNITENVVTTNIFSPLVPKVIVSVFITAKLTIVGCPDDTGLVMSGI